MLKIIECKFEDLTYGERALAPENGSGMEYANYIKITHNGKSVLFASDAMEPEDALFTRDLDWIVPALRRCYEIGRSEGLEK